MVARPWIHFSRSGSVKKVGLCVREFLQADGTVEYSIEHQKLICIGKVGVGLDLNFFLWINVTILVRSDLLVSWRVVKSNVV